MGLLLFFRSPGGYREARPSPIFSPFFFSFLSPSIFIFYFFLFLNKKAADSLASCPLIYFVEDPPEFPSSALNVSSFKPVPFVLPVSHEFIKIDIVHARHI